MEPIEIARARLARCVGSRGDLGRDLAIGAWTIRFQGLDPGLAADLETRWGGFLTSPSAAPPRLRVEIVGGDGEAWLPSRPGEGYRLEATTDDAGVLVRSYRFAMAPRGEQAWRLSLDESDAEPVGRILDNAARYLVARLAAEDGGAAFHGAAVLRDDRAWVFAGPSRSGKSTAVTHSAPGRSLGDDFAVVVPSGTGWSVPAVPFDNGERAPVDPVRGLVPLAGIYRLFQAASPRVERPTGPLAQASIMACLAFPWALPDLADRLGAAVTSLAASGRFAHLWFAPEPSFWRLLEDAD